MSLKGVVDLQLYVAYARLVYTNRPGRRVGLFSALRDYLKLKDAKKPGKVSARMKAGQKVWDERPLTNELVSYATEDVKYMHALFRELCRRSPTFLEPTMKLSKRCTRIRAVSPRAFPVSSPLPGPPRIQCIFPAHTLSGPPRTLPQSGVYKEGVVTWSDMGMETGHGGGGQLSSQQRFTIGRC